MLADEGVFPSWVPNGVSYGVTHVLDLPIRDLMSSGLVDFQPFVKSYVYEDNTLEGRPLHPSLGIGGVLAAQRLVFSIGEASYHAPTSLSARSATFFPRGHA